MSHEQNLFPDVDNSEWQPLADRMRPQKIDDIVGQQHLLGKDKSLRLAIENGKLHSLILWGPPGTGKTTLSRMIANYCDAEFISLSAVLSGVKDIREAVSRAQQYQQQGKPSILFVDEVHRFNKSQQDAFLPYVEDGTFTFIGATTENPSFELNNALLSRARVYVLKSINEDDLVQVLKRALNDTEKGLGNKNIQVDGDVLSLLGQVADGDARRALNLLEIASDLTESNIIDKETIKSISGENLRRFDNHGEAFYDQISALHKSVRGSAPDAALYWLVRMLDGGCDPLYVARRVVRMASEDIGNADPRALTLAMQAWDVLERLGSPEGELALAQAVLYLASAAKSNAVYKAYNQAKADIKQYASVEVPVHLRNAPTKLMKELGYGKEYRYAHDEPEAYAAGESYFPETMPEMNYYQPVERGLEIKIKEKLAHLRELDQKAGKKS
ncbi:MAG: replication-associated recombination protein A [Gammaproteobacteria bacterium]|nr:replication-associated recombination protein A [Gammaproteobacteria bacterium]